MVCIEKNVRPAVFSFASSYNRWRTDFVAGAGAANFNGIEDFEVIE